MKDLMVTMGGLKLHLLKTPLPSSKLKARTLQQNENQWLLTMNNHLANITSFAMFEKLSVSFLLR